MEPTTRASTIGAMKLALACNVVVLGVLLGCGSVKSDPGMQRDASPIDGAGVCTIHDTVDSCGAMCTKCPAADDRQMPTCNGAMCGVACLNAAPRCTDNSCSRLAWTFDSNMLDGIAPREPNGLRISVRNHAGNLALAIDVDNLGNGVSITLPICLTGNLQLQAKRLKATVYFDGGDPSNLEQYYLQGSVPAPMPGGILQLQGAPPRAYVAYSAAISDSQFANTASKVVITAGTFGAAFKGTVWLDDIKIE